MSTPPTLVLAGGAIPTPTLVLGEPKADSLELLYVVQTMVSRYPQATSVIARALLAEGKRFAATPEGAALAARVAGSPALARLRAVWEGIATTLPDDAGIDIMPTDALELVARSPDGADELHELLARLLRSPEAP